jgi:ABC-type transport system involved in multi-copper enzyme maturation permease subunit
LIGGSWLALSFRSGYWNTSYLWSIGVLTFQFAILYSVSVLFGVLWRSWIGSVLMTALSWVLFTATNWAYRIVHSPDVITRLDQKWITLTDVVYYIFPKTNHLGQLNQVMLAKSNKQGTSMAEMMEEMLPTAITWEMVLLSSGAFILVMIALACWRFAKRDY